MRNFIVLFTINYIVLLALRKFYNKIGTLEENEFKFMSWISYFKRGIEIDSESEDNRSLE